MSDYPQTNVSQVTATAKYMLCDDLGEVLHGRVVRVFDETAALSDIIDWASAWVPSGAKLESLDLLPESTRLGVVR